MRAEFLFKRMNKKQARRDANIAERIRAAGERARKEAAARQNAGKSEPRTAKEIGGPAGPEPTRYGDWERKGVASDF